MLYGKIYLDKTENGQSALNFVSLSLSKEDATDTTKVEYIAISNEAKTAFINMLDGDNKYLGGIFADFELYGDNSGCAHGYFWFKEDKIENGLRFKTLNLNATLKIKTFKGLRRDVFNYMIPCDNEVLKTLDLNAKIDENALWQSYFNSLKEKGVTLTADVETIIKTPYNFLTNEQKTAIKNDYYDAFNSYDIYHQNNNAEEISEIIIGELITKYKKRKTEVEFIIFNQL